MANKMTDGTTNPPIHFLTYLNRSGSTLLAKKLSQYSEIGVGFEVEYERKLQGNMPTFHDKMELNRFLDGMYSDPKYLSWGPTREELETSLGEIVFPYPYRELLGKVFDLQLGGEGQTCYIHKAGAFFRFIPKLSKSFPDSRFLCIMRDPRGIFNSQRKAIDSRTSAPMQSDVSRFALQFHKRFKTLNSLLDLEELHLIRYEDLLEHEQETMLKLTTFLGVQSERNLDNNHYYSAIPEQQKHLHTSLKHEDDMERINAWQKELDPTEIRFLEIILKPELQMLDYSVAEKPSLSISEKLKLLWVLGKYFTRLRYLRFRLTGEQE